MRLLLPLPSINHFQEGIYTPIASAWPKGTKRFTASTSLGKPGHSVWNGQNQLPEEFQCQNGTMGQIRGFHGSLLCF